MSDRKSGFIVLVVILVLVLVLHSSRGRRSKGELYPSTLSTISGIYRIDTLSQTLDTVAVQYRSYQLLRLNLNSASKEELMAVYGIGEVLSERIMEYRDKLGGYYSVEQLGEIRGIDNGVYEKIFRNFYVPDSSYSKISINFASPESLREHPYFTISMVRRVEAARKRGGYFTNLQELIDNDILLPSEALRVAPYLSYEKHE